MIDRTIPIFYVKVLTPQGVIEPDQSVRITSLEYEDCEKKADKIRLTVDNYDLSHFDNPIWQKGNLIELTWGYPGVLAPPRRGVIQAVKGFQQLQVEAISEALLLNLATKTRAFENMTRSQVARQIAIEWGFSEGYQHVEDTEEIHPVISQARQTDGEFLRRLAHKEGFELYLDFDGFHFHSRDTRQDVSRVFHYHTDPGAGDIISMNIENDITDKAGMMRVLTRNARRRQDDQGEASTTDPLPAMPTLAPVQEFSNWRHTLQGQASTYFQRLEQQYDSARGTPAAGMVRSFEEPIRRGAAYANFMQSVEGSLRQVNAAVVAGSAVQFANAIRERIETSVENAAQEARLRQRAMQQLLVQISMTVVGDPTLLAKSVIEIRGIGHRLSGLYYVTDVKHRIDPGGYTCDVKCWSDGTQGYQYPAIVEPRATSRELPPPETDAERQMRWNALGESRQRTPDGQEYVVFRDTGGRQWRVPVTGPAAPITTAEE